MKKSKLGGFQKNQCIEYYRKHPEASISQVAKAIGVSDRTAASARAELVAAGELAPGRSQTPIPESGTPILNEVKESPTPTPEPAPAPKPESKKPSKTSAVKEVGGDALVDSKALQRMAEMQQALEEDHDDEEVIKQTMKLYRSFIFNPALHPDTRMAAGEAFRKLKDRERQTALGPGKPATHEDAVQRLTDILLSAGTSLTIEALYRAFPSLVEVANADQAVDEGQPQPASAEGAGTPHNETQA